MKRQIGLLKAGCGAGTIGGGARKRPPLSTSEPNANNASGKPIHNRWRLSFHTTTAPRVIPNGITGITYRTSATVVVLTAWGEAKLMASVYSTSATKARGKNCAFLLIKANTSAAIARVTE